MKKSLLFCMAILLSLIGMSQSARNKDAYKQVAEKLPAEPDIIKQPN